MTLREKSMPHLAGADGARQLIVDDEPFLILGAELQNSSMTSSEYMRTVWSKLAAANINTVLGCVTWEQIEPEEGTFDFKELDQILLDARSHGLKLVLLWFGSFKNGRSFIRSSSLTNETKACRHTPLLG
jgi:beta-galactosidase GanA